MILCDIGNTSYHFLDEEKEYKKDASIFNPSTIKEQVYYICVNRHVKNILTDLANWIDISQYISKSQYYETMGIDRIVACEAISDGIIVDAGSAITIDVVQNNEFQGGFIYPGVKAMGKTYSDISSALEYPFNFNLNTNILPKNSQDAISYGYLKLLYTEVTSYKQNIYLTGGDANKFISLFPHAKTDKLLLFKGMKKIIQGI